MSNLQQFQRGMNQAWDRVVEGWRQLHERADQAMTRFIPSTAKTEISSAQQRDTEIRNSGWGVLAAEVYEQGEHIIVNLEAPGMERDDLDIRVVDDLLVITGEKHVEQQRDEGRYHITECAYGRFERAIPLPDVVEANGAKAKYRRGILRIELPRHASRKRRTIPVEAA